MLQIDPRDALPHLNHAEHTKRLSEATATWRFTNFVLYFCTFCIVSAQCDKLAKLVGRTSTVASTVNV